MFSRELFLHRTMQTDPNWANFLYNPEKNTIGLLDFGATREFKPKFVNTYFKIIDAAAHKDRVNVLKYSQEIGFLTGYESKLMNDAHVDSVMLLAVPFHKNEPYDFGRQTITHDIQVTHEYLLMKNTSGYKILLYRQIDIQTNRQTDPLTFIIWLE